MKKRHFIILLIIISISSCTSHKKLRYLSNLDTTDTEQFFPLVRPDYRIQYQDILYINITTLNSEMNELLNAGVQQTSNVFRDERSFFIFGYTVSDSGTISLPVLGEIYVYGLTMDELKISVQQRADELLKDATINIRLLSFKFTVIGEVNRPGTYTNYNNQLTVLDAIGMAGDITDFGDRRFILIVRPAKEGTYTYRINVQDKNLLQSEGYFLLPNDIVIVEPIKSKPFQLNIPTMGFFLSTISTMILILAFIGIK
ncbi:polysaccharide biosynthesis/export family protein [Bacteroidota bacterium]